MGLRGRGWKKEGLEGLEPALLTEPRLQALPFRLRHDAAPPRLRESRARASPRAAVVLLLRQEGFGAVRLAQVRWSRYNPSFLEPEVNKELYQKPFNELSEEEKEKQELKAVHPIKAAPPSISSSVFSDPMISKFTNMMMKDGNKVLARSLMAQTLENIKRKQLEKYHRAPDDEKETVECNPYVIFHQALKNCQPIIGLSNITRGGKTYQVPVPLKDNRKRFLAMKWLITECRENKHRRTLMPEKLSEELIQAFNNEGPIIKKKHVLHKMAEANRAYAHFRWW